MISSSKCNCFECTSRCNFPSSHFCRQSKRLKFDTERRFMISSTIFTLFSLLQNVFAESWNTIAPIRNNCSECPFVYNLVCGQDGKMYSSQCIAICRNVVSLFREGLWGNKSQFGWRRNKTSGQLIFWYSVSWQVGQVIFWHVIYWQVIFVNVVIWQVIFKQVIYWQGIFWQVIFWQVIFNKWSFGK